MRRSIIAGLALLAIAAGGGVYWYKFERTEAAPDPGAQAAAGGFAIPVEAAPVKLGTVERTGREALLEMRRLLDLVLDEMPFELRTIFVLVELEELAVSDVAELVDVPPGTAASRLRRDDPHGLRLDLDAARRKSLQQRR